MEWQSFFIGMGVMLVLMAVVFALIPSRRKPDAQMQILHGFWRENIRISLETQEVFKSIAESLRKSHDPHAAHTGASEKTWYEGRGCREVDTVCF